MGWGFGNGLRAELEGDFRYNSVKSVSGYGSAFTSASGKENKYGVMVNSGSSANLVAVASLFFKKDKPLQKGDEVVAAAHHRLRAAVEIADPQA